MRLRLGGLAFGPSHLAWLAAVAVAVLLTIPALATVAQAGPTDLWYYAEDFTSGKVVVPSSTQAEGFTPGIYGWNLLPHDSGRLAYTIHRPRGRDLTVKLWFYTGGSSGVTGEVSVRLDGGPPVTIARDPRFVGSQLPLPSDVAVAQDIEIDLTATNQSNTEQLVVDRLSWSSAPSGPPYPSPRWSRWALGLLAGLLALSLLRDPRRWAIAAALALTVAVAADLRLGAVVLAAHVYPANPDTMAYQAWADRFRWWPLDRGFFCGCYGPREPVWVAIGHLLSQLFGSSTFHLRALTALLSVLDVGLAVAAARRRLGWPASLAVGVLLALNGPVISNATRGLRTELEMTLCLLLYLLLDRPPSRRPYLEATAVGLTGTALALTRTFFLPAVILVVAISLLLRRTSARSAALALFVAAVLPVAGTVAHRIGLYNQPLEYGLTRDAFLDTDSYARWNANTEKFLLDRPMPHPELFPTSQEYEKNGPYYGPKLTYAQYLFELHTPLEVVTFSLAGYADVVRSTIGFLQLAPESLVGDPSVQNADLALGFGHFVDILVRALGAVGLIGMVVAARRRPQLILVPAMYVGILGFAVFLYHVGLVERYYNIVQAWPFFYIAAAWLVEQGVIAVRAPDFRVRLSAVGLGLQQLPRQLLATPGLAELTPPTLALVLAAGLSVSLATHDPRPNRVGLGLAVLAVVTAAAIGASRLALLPDLSRAARWAGLAGLVATVLAAPPDRIARGQFPAALGALLVLGAAAWLSWRRGGRLRGETVLLLAGAAPLCLVTGALAGPYGVVSLVTLVAFSLAPEPSQPADQLEPAEGDQGHAEQEHSVPRGADLRDARDAAAVADRDLEDRQPEASGTEQ